MATKAMAHPAAPDRAVGLRPEPVPVSAVPASIPCVDGLAKLRVPFPPHHISKLPKPTTKDGRKGNCAECGGYHQLPAIHLDYVGHAALTDRLLDTDPEWSWEPVSFDSDGLPAFDRLGGLWIKLTVLGVTRLGYGSADGKAGGNAIKEAIGDALRNAAMRFGAALDLWHKGDLHLEAGQIEEDAVSPANDRNNGKIAGTNISPREKLEGPYSSKTALWNAFKALDRDVRGCGDPDTLDALMGCAETVELIKECQRYAPQLLTGGPDMPGDFVPLDELVAQRRKDFADIAEAERIAGYART